MRSVTSPTDSHGLPLSSLITSISFSSSPSPHLTHTRPFIPTATSNGNCAPSLGKMGFLGDNNLSETNEVRSAGARLVKRTAMAGGVCEGARDLRPAPSELDPANKESAGQGAEACSLLCRRVDAGNLGLGEGRGGEEVGVDQSSNLRNEASCRQHSPTKRAPVDSDRSLIRNTAYLQVWLIAFACSFEGESV